MGHLPPLWATWFQCSRLLFSFCAIPSSASSGMNKLMRLRVERE